MEASGERVSLSVVAAAADGTRTPSFTSAVHVDDMTYVSYASASAVPSGAQLCSGYGSASAAATLAEGNALEAVREAWRAWQSNGIEDVRELRRCSVLGRSGASVAAEFCRVSRGRVGEDGAVFGQVDGTVSDGRGVSRVATVRVVVQGDGFAAAEGGARVAAVPKACTGADAALTRHTKQCRCTPQGTGSVETMTVYRSITGNYPKLHDVVAADILGVLDYMCTMDTQNPYIAQFTVDVDTNWGEFLDCTSGSCTSVHNPSSACRVSVGREGPWSHNVNDLGACGMCVCVCVID